VVAALAQVVSEGKVDIAGCVDATQVVEVVEQWHENGNVEWKLPLLQQVLRGAFTGKKSTPYGDGTVHDFMHAKIVVADDVVFTGSFNVSGWGEKKAETVREIHDPARADPRSASGDGVRRRSPPVQLPPATPTRSSKAASTKDRAPHG